MMKKSVKKQILDVSFSALIYAFLIVLLTDDKTNEYKIN